MQQKNDMLAFKFGMSNYKPTSVNKCNTNFQLANHWHHKELKERETQSVPKRSVGAQRSIRGQPSQGDPERSSRKAAAWRPGRVSKEGGPAGAAKPDRKGRKRGEGH